VSGDEPEKNKATVISRKKTNPELLPFTSQDLHF
jgi:hypothetical protein